MPGPKPLALELSPRERRELEAMVRRRSTPQQIAQRARIVLRAAEGQTNSAIGRELGLDADTVRGWRSRWHGLQAVRLEDLSAQERLEDLPRSGRPPEITAEQVCQMVALACEAPQTSGRPISQWTGAEIAREVMGRGIVEKISARHASRLLKRGI
jgi:DNA-binding CsgD family transcriptional regulator